MRLKNRPYTEDTLMMLIIMHNEGDSLKHMVELLGRRPETIVKVIIELFKKGYADKIHKKLMAHNGLYARRMAGKPWPVCRFDKGENQ